MRNYVMIALCAMAVAACALEAWAQVPARLPADAASPLPIAPARVTTLRVCSTCHATEIVAQQRLTPQGWKDLVDKMADQGAVASEAELLEITNYLSASFPAQNDDEGVDKR